MARTIEVTETAKEVLRRECLREIENAAQERSMFSTPPKVNSEEVAKQTENLLAASDLYGALMWARPTQEKRGELYLTDDAEEWLGSVWGQTKGHLDYLASHQEAEFDYIAQEAYLVDVVGRILNEPKAVA